MRAWVEYFPAYWEQVSRTADLQRQCELLAMQYAQSEKDNAKLAAALDAAREAIQTNPSYMNGVMDLLQRYQEKMLTEEPFPDGKIPESAWLTPEIEDPVHE